MGQVIDALKRIYDTRSREQIAKLVAPMSPSECDEIAKPGAMNSHIMEVFDARSTGVIDHRFNRH